LKLTRLLLYFEQALLPDRCHRTRRA
jgi:hypothetical protein